VPDPPSIEVIGDDLLAELYDPGSLARGSAYADDGRVVVLRAEPGMIEATCRGSAPVPYAMSIRWSGHRGAVRLDDSCSCPVGDGCKHCVAAIVTARRAAERAAARAGAPPGGGWRRVLADLAADDDHDVAPTGLALQVAVLHPVRRRYAVGTEPRLVVRPLRRGRTGSWIKTGASWRDIASQYDVRLADVDLRHRAALRAVMASGPADIAYGGNQAVPLSRFSADVWHQLARAVEVGVELVAERKSGVVALSPTPARVRVDLTAADDGAVTLATRFTVDDEVVPVGGDHGGLLGTPPHGLWTLDGDHLRLVPLVEPLHPAVARLATTDPLTVPAADVDELVDVYQPALARHADLGSPDGSVDLATVGFDGLVAVVERTAVDVATLRWSARYRSTRRVEHHPLRSPSGRVRDREAEAAALAELALPTHLLAELAEPDGSPRDLTVTGPAVVTLLTEILPWLEARCGVDVELVGGQPALREATEDPHIALHVLDGDERRDGNDWFDLDVEVRVDDQVVDFASLFAALDRGDDALILPSGTWLRLDRPELARLRELIDEARTLAEPTGAGVARVNRFQASWWDELTGLGVVARQSQRWADSVARMTALAAPEPVEVPAGLDATLRPYQQEGLDWLAFLHRNGLGGILGDDMGLGKTVQVLALMLHVLERDPTARFLVVAPTSVVENWAREAARFAPGVAVRTISGSAARRGTTLEEAIADATVVVTSYALFRIEHHAYARQRWELLLLDEAQFVKNHRGKTYQCVRRTDAATTIAITGTPLENSLMDLWSLLSITAPGLYPDPKRFDETYRKPIESGDAPERLAALRRRIAPLLRRRTKDAVLAELPPKIEQVVEVEMSARHARIYETQLQRQRQHVLGLVGDVRRHRFAILRSLTVLRQLALDPGLVDDAHDTVGSAKLDRLLADLTQVVAEGHRALVFSQFTRFLARVRRRLDAAGIDHSYLDGRTLRRDDAISRFRDGDVPVFVISLKAGGFGLNLTEADYCFVLDPWWNPAAETQAVDRAHRIGQQNPVMVYRYVSTGTIEEKVVELKARKADLFDSVMDAEGALAGALTEDDVRGLLDLG
jgi:superfamily II DNA or RNA helicase